MRKLQIGGLPGTNLQEKMMMEKFRKKIENEKKLKNRPSISKWTPKPGEIERLERQDEARRKMDQAPLNRLADNSHMAKAWDNLVVPMAEAEMALTGAKLAGAGLKAFGKMLTEETALKNAYKLNPYAFKPNPEAAYRGIGKEGYEDLLVSGEIKSLKQNSYPEPYFMKGSAGFTKGYPSLQNYAKGYMVELGPKEPMKGVGAFKDYYEDLIGTPVNKIKLDNPNLKILKEHWLKGYKEVPKPKTRQEVWWDGNKYVTTPPHSEQITRGPIDWADAVDRDLNPNFNARMYENYLKSPYAPPIIGEGAPYLKRTGVDIAEDLRRLPDEDSFNYINMGEKPIKGQGYALDPEDLLDPSWKQDAGKTVGKWLNERKMGRADRIGQFLNLPKNKKGGIIDSRGQWAHPGKRTMVPTPDGKITMKGVPYPVWAQDETGFSQMMYPGEEYQFPGQMVDEIPLMQGGGTKKTWPPTLAEISQIPSKKRDDFKSWFPFLSNIVSGGSSRKEKPEYGKLTDLYRYYAGEDLKYDILEKSKYKPSNSKDINQDYISIKDPNFINEVLDTYDRVSKGELLNSSHGKEFKYPNSDTYNVSGYLNKKEAWAMGHYNISKGKDDRGEYISYYDKFDATPGNKKNLFEKIGIVKPFEIYGRIYLDQKTGKPIMQKGGRVPIYVSNPDDRRLKAYNDSLNLYKAMVMQDKLMGTKKGTPAPFTKDQWTTKELKDRRTPKKVKGLPQPISQDFISEKDQFSQGFDPVFARKQDKELLDYYKSLGFRPDRIEYHTSPDIVSDDIRPIGNYFDGTATSPVYKKPVQPVVYRKSESKPATNPVGRKDYYMVDDGGGRYTNEQEIMNQMKPTQQGISGTPFYGPNGHLVGYMQGRKFVPYENEGMNSDDRNFLKNKDAVNKLLQQRYGKYALPYEQKFQRGGMIKNLFDFIFNEEELVTKDNPYNSPTVDAPDEEEILENQPEEQTEDYGPTISRTAESDRYNRRRERVSQMMQQQSANGSVPITAEDGINPYAASTRQEILSTFPGTRDLGIWGDRSHQQRQSDHNTGDAWDVGVTPEIGDNILKKIQSEAKERNIKYIIYQGKIWNPSVSPEWRPYNGPNKHSEHIHISYNR